MPDGGAILSSTTTAFDKSRLLASGLDGYAQLSPRSAASLSSGAPPAAHDHAFSTLNEALDGYKVSLMRDADALEEIAKVLNSIDYQVAIAMLGA